MRILRIRNFEKYQDRMKTKNAPWIKLYTKLLCDIDFLKLDVEARYLYVGLLILAAETGNSTVNDPAYLCHRLAIERSRFNLTPLFRSGLLIASERTIRRERERENREREGEGEAQAPPTPKVRSKPDIALPEDWIPKEHHARFAVARGLDLKLEAQHFCGRAQELEWVTKDWDRKFSNWMLQELKYRQRRQA
jgi:hypothetical protein